MKKAYIPAGALMVAALAVGIAGMSPVFSDEELTLDQVPDAVRATIEAQAGQGTVTEIEREVEDGRVLYDAEIIIDGKEIEIEISDTGELLGSEAEGEDADEADDDDGDDEDERTILLKDAPQAVQDALARLLPGVTVDELTRETEDGLEVYELTYEVAGSEHSIELTDDGYVLESEEEIEPSDLPPAVMSAIAEAFAGADIEEAEIVQQTAYEVELIVGGKKHELVVLANGHIVK